MSDPYSTNRGQGSSTPSPSPGSKGSSLVDLRHPRPSLSSPGHSSTATSLRRRQVMYNVHADPTDYDDEDDLVNPCTKEIEPSEPPPFDYHGFYQYHQLTNLVFEISKWENYEAATASRKMPLPELDANSNEYLDYYQKIFEDLHGKIAMTEQMKAVMASVKATMAEAMDPPMEASELMEALIDVGIFEHTPSRGKEALMKLISSEFSPEQREMYENLDPAAGSGAWFNLPRPDPKQLRNQHFANFPYVEDNPRGFAMYGDGEEFNSDSGDLDRRPSDYVLECLGKLELDPLQKQKKEKKTLALDQEDIQIKEADRRLNPGTRGTLGTTLEKSESDPEEGSSTASPSHGSAEGLDSESSYPERTEVFTCNALTGLHLYDPKFELCFSLPYRIFSTPLGGFNRSVPKMLSYRILSLLNEFPFGITPKQFWVRFFSLNNYLPKVGSLSPNELLRLHSPELYSDEFPPVTSSTLVFPGFLEGILSPRLIVQRIWHAILCQVASTGAVRLQDIFEELERQHGFKFDPLSWGCGSIHDFLEALLEHFSYNNVLTLYRVNYVKDHVAESVDYLMINSKCLKTELQRRHNGCGGFFDGFDHSGETEETGSQVKAVNGGQGQGYGEEVPYEPLPKDAMGMEDVIDCVANHLSDDVDVEVYLQRCVDPYRLTLIKCDMLEELDQFHESLQVPPLRRLIDYLERPHRSQLTPGLYVMVPHCQEWYRARIIWQDEDKDQLYVYCIDWGYLLYVDYADVNFMPRHPKISEPLAFAIPAQLMVPNCAAATATTRSEFLTWDDDLTEQLFDMANGRIMKPRWHSAEYSPVLGCLKWSIETATLLHMDTRKLERACLTVAFNKIVNAPQEDRPQLKLEIKTLPLKEPHGYESEPTDSAVPSEDAVALPEKDKLSMVFLDELWKTIMGDSPPSKSSLLQPLPEDDEGIPWAKSGNEDEEQKPIVSSEGKDAAPKKKVSMEEIDELWKRVMGKSPPSITTLRDFAPEDGVERLPWVRFANEDMDPKQKPRGAPTEKPRRLDEE